MSQWHNDIFQNQVAILDLLFNLGIGERSAPNKLEESGKVLLKRLPLLCFIDRQPGYLNSESACAKIHVDN